MRTPQSEHHKPADILLLVRRFISCFDRMSDEVHHRSPTHGIGAYDCSSTFLPSFFTKIIIYDNDKRIHLLLCLSVVVLVVFVKPETDRYDLFLVETDLYDLFSPVNLMSDNSFIVLPKVSSRP